MQPLLTFKVEGQPQLEAKLKALSEALDTKAILDEGAAVIFNRMRDNFLRETDPSGHRWPRSQAAIHREKIGRGGGTLFDVGTLWRSIQLYADSDTTRSIGTNVTSKKGFPYGKVHQWGWGGQIQRQFLGFGEEDVKTMTDVVLRRIVQGLSS